ncbi:E3 ubiquitin-protein ligase PDZRN3 isoform X2 [Rhipicephalus sanguineus]|uniref:E3 ubiquitin-protein ligase PDZRN3 isoform X2 n=1 Tax=Rhipicephalus sanguineus TaxID=34632 RepID=UPI0018947EAC|nr:E3 ubiquitin-protein ligase PDZRN3 isoform X2 [Rhipicephalus sanguineus]
MDFVVLRVNGRDVSNASHEEAVAAFRAASEPIVVEVLRRERRNGTGSSSSDFGGSGSSCAGGRAAKQAVVPSPSGLSQGYIDAAAQTEFPWWAPPPWEGSLLPNGLSIPPPPLSPPSRNEDQDDDDGYDIEYEEVTLIRNGNEKLGLTLCYGDPDEQETEIYVGEIDPRSVAAKDGRLQEGDQILQVNGTDVLGRDQAIVLFSEQRPDFTLLVARTHVSEEDEDEDGNEKDAATTPSKADALLQTSFQEELSETETQVGTPLPDNDLEMSVLANEFQRVILDKKAASVEQWLHQGSSGLPTSPQKWDAADSGSSAYHTGGSSSASPPTLELGGRSGSLLSLAGAPVSTPVYPSLPPMTRTGTAVVSSGHGMGPTEDKSTQLRDSDMQSLTSCESCRCHLDFATSPRRLPKTVSEPACVRRGSSVPDYASLYPTMYTNKQNLQHTMWLQQHLFREALARRNGRVHATKTSSSSVVAASTSTKKDQLVYATTGGGEQPGGDETDLKSQWKVKRRADGTRYITRRPARTKLLKEREQKILEERSGLTTDDDNHSELKTGKYWTKEERKRHLEKARDRKKKEMMLKLKMAILKEAHEGSGTKKSTTSAASRKKREVSPSPESLVGVVGDKAFGLLAVTTV